MNDIVQRAKQAREKLATALAILQSPEAGSLIDTVAEPVARAMGALHSLEGSQGADAPIFAPIALNGVRAALVALQDVVQNPAADHASEYIAGSLSIVHGLAEDTKRASAAPPAAPQVIIPSSPPAAPQVIIPSSPPVMTAPDVGTAPVVATAPTAPVAVVASASARPSGLDRTQLAGSSRPPASPLMAPDVALEPAAGRERRNSKHASAPPEGMPPGATPVEANLGAHSPTNFYKGLSGNDVVDDGGLFVATYDIPRIGTKLWLTVNMPGGYDFQAVAEVRWTRETGVGDAPPGYGCAFQALSADARRLVYRYVKNREPLFHDDV